MVILPAIDLMGGQCVRLRQGRADQRTVYNDDPVAQARAFKEAGAEHLHVVDLDGAFSGKPAHADLIARIIRECGLSVEVGGGLRTDEAVEAVLAAGVARAIIGTRALEDEAALGRWVAKHGERIAVGIDARDGFVQTKGWVETSAVRATDLARRMAALGVRTIIYTDTATDGAASPPRSTWPLSVRSVGLTSGAPSLARPFMKAPSRCPNSSPPPAEGWLAPFRRTENRARGKRATGKVVVQSDEAAVLYVLYVLYVLPRRPACASTPLICSKSAKSAVPSRWQSFSVTLCARLCEPL